jgi:tRNA(His) 5'-end guanylyltransferase
LDVWSAAIIRRFGFCCGFFLQPRSSSSRWTLRKSGCSVGQATKRLEGQSTAFKNEWLFQHGINFNELPAWQRRGTGLYWERYEKEGFNPVTKQTITAGRRCVKIDRELPMKEEYDAMIRRLLTAT